MIWRTEVGMTTPDERGRYGVIFQIVECPAAWAPLGSDVRYEWEVRAVTGGTCAKGEDKDSRLECMKQAAEWMVQNG